MPKNKKTKKLNKKTKPAKKLAKKVLKKALRKSQDKQKNNKATKKATKKVKIVPKKKVVLSKKAQEDAHKLNKLIIRGKEKGFVTFDEILKEFPTIEDNIIFLDEIYTRLHSLAIDVLESGGLLEMPVEETGKKYSYNNKSDSAYDSIQMYLKEIGQYRSEENT